jgi:hypothetical protein
MLKKINIKSSWVIGVIFLLIATLRLWPFLCGQTLAMFDNYSLMVPMKLFQASWIKQGIIPLWNPLLFSGISLIGDINQSLFYPSTLLFVLLKPVWAINLTLLIHLALTGLGMFYLAKTLVRKNSIALLAGILWLLSSQVTNSLNNLSLLQSLTWTPWIMWLGLLLPKQTKADWWLPILIFLQMMGGYPQHVLYAVLGAVFLSLFDVGEKKIGWKKWLKIWFKIGIISLALSAMVWLPFIKTFINSTRVVQTATQSVSGSLHPIELVKIIAPTFFDNLQLGLRWGPKWNETPYLAWYVGWLGLLVPVSVLISKKRSRLDLWLMSGVLFTLWFALGESALGFGLLQKLVPVLKISRIPTTILGVGTILIILWLVSSLSRFRISQKFFKLLIFNGMIVLLFALGGLILSKFYPQTLWQLLNSSTNSFFIESVFHTLERDALIIQSIAQSLIISLILFVLALWMWYQKNWAGLIIFLTLDVFIQTQNLLLFAPATVYPTTAEANSQEILPEFYLTSQERILTRNFNQPYTGFAAYWDAVSVRPPFSDSYLNQSDFTHLERFRQGLTPDWNQFKNIPVVNGYSTLLPQDYVRNWTGESSINQLPTLAIDNPLLSTWAVKYYLVDTWFESKEDLSNYSLVAEYKDWQLYELPSLPRFRFIDGKAVKFLEFKENPNFISFSFENPDSYQQLVIADRYDSDWQAEINDQKTELRNYQGMRILNIEPGKNEIKLSYRPSWFYLGLIISGLTMIGGGWWLLVKRKSCTNF